jgi:hypothetical protein
MNDEEKHTDGCPLDNALRVACEIYHYNTIDSNVWFSKLVDSLAWCMSKMEVSHAMDTLDDWLIIFREPGATKPGYCGFNWYVDEDEIHKIKPLYEKYWKDFRHPYTDETPNVRTNKPKEIVVITIDRTGKKGETLWEKIKRKTRISK